MSRQLRYTEGYTQENCRVILWGLNAAFGTWGEEAFCHIARAWLSEKDQETLTSVKAA